MYYPIQIIKRILSLNELESLGFMVTRISNQVFHVLYGDLRFHIVIEDLDVSVNYFKGDEPWDSQALICIPVSIKNYESGIKVIYLECALLFESYEQYLKEEVLKPIYDWCNLIRSKTILYRGDLDKATWVEFK